MTSANRGVQFTVELSLQKAGPLKPRRKYKEHQLLTASHTIQLPFVPFAGLILTFTGPERRGRSNTAYLRVRCVEWLVARSVFSCVVDEISMSLDSHAMNEVRDGPLIEKHFRDLEMLLGELGFKTSTDSDGCLWALYKTSSGYEFDDPPYRLTTDARGRGQTY